MDTCENTHAATVTSVWKKVKICLRVSVGGCDTRVCKRGHGVCEVGVCMHTYVGVNVKCRV